MAHPYLALPTPLVIGHRGASGELPENTLPAFERALSQGAVILETDVHRSRDGVVVIAHDPDVSRMTDGRGQVSELSWGELSKLDAGHGFSPDGGRTHPLRGRGFRIPELREAFDRFPETRFNIELKQNDPALIDATLDLVVEYGREKLTLLAAAEDDTMASLRARLAETRTAVAVGASAGDVLAFVQAAISGGEPPAGPMALQIPPNFAGQPLVTAELVAFAHRHGVHVHVWTVNEPEEMHRLLDLGVDGIMSDYPARLRAVVEERSRG